MVRLIHFCVRGRARYNVEGLYRSEPLKRYLEERFSKIEGITFVSANILTGNVLVLFTDQYSPQLVATLIERFTADYSSYHSSNNQNLTQNSKIKLQNVRKVYTRRKVRKLVLQAEEQESEPWHLQDVVSVLLRFNVDKDRGLSSDVAKQHLKKYGPNILPESVPRSGWGILLDQFKSMPVLLLMVAAGISIFTGGIADAIVIASVVLINAVIGYTTEIQAERTIHSLKTLIRPTALVIRDGGLQEIGAEEIVPGDILVLRPGCYVAADARLIEASHLSVDESALTGESIPVVKKIDTIVCCGQCDDSEQNDVILASEPSYIPLADRKNMIYMGTLVTGGQGLAVVVATGRFTEIGKIQGLIGDTKPPQTPMEAQLDKISTQLVIIGSGICGLVFIIGLLRGYGLLQMLKTSISLAVAAVPEGLPTLATTTLALGIRKMRQYKVLIRHLDAVETLGSVQTICLDKTGTITMNRMSVVAIYVGMRSIKVSNGSFLLDDGKEICTNLHHKIDPYECDELLRIIQVSVLCNESAVSMQDGKYVVNGSATENALIYAALSCGVDIFKLREQFPLLKILHRSENRNVMASVHNIRAMEHSGRCLKLIAIKGSPNEVLSMCSFYIKNGQKLPLQEEDRLTIEIENERMAGDALRVLGVAYAYVDDGKDCFEQPGLHPEIDPETLMGCAEIVWLGLMGMADPIREGVKDLIAVFHQAGIDTVMITGDQSPTAFAIGTALNLSKNEQLQVLDSTHISDINPEVMQALCERVHVFSRVSPAHKLQIVQAIQRAGKIVAMTGDGINDGPALKAADIGIAMGYTGTDLAREVADVVLEDDKLETMIIAISHGRTIYNNIRKSVHFLLATNLSEIMVMFTGIALGLGEPLSAMQLLWINLISDIAPGLALALEPPEPHILSQPPRDPNKPIISSSDFKRVTFEAATLSIGALGAHGYGIMRYGLGPRAGSLAFLSLTIGQILHAISCRSEQHSIFGKDQLSPNRYLDIAVLGSLGLQALSLLLPGLRGLLGIAPLGLLDGLVIGGSVLVPFLVNESSKGLR